MLDPVVVSCPYCGEAFETEIDTSGGSQRYIEDCHVCCRPIEFVVGIDADGGIVGMETRRDDD